MFEPADFLEESLRWAAGVLSGEVTVERPEVTRDEAEWAAAVKAAKGLVDLKTGGRRRRPTARWSSSAAARTATRDEAFAAEDEALADLLMSDELRAGLYSFDLVQKRAKRPAGAPDKALARPVTKVGIVGAGLMASQLALLFVQRLEVPVVLTDLDEDRVAKGVGYVHGEVDKLLGQGAGRPGQGEPPQGPGHRRRRARTASPTPTSSSRRSSRRCRSRSRSSPRSRPSSRPSACSRPTPRRCRSPRWPPTWRTPSGSSASTSSTRSPSCRCSRSSRASAPTTPLSQRLSPPARR